MLRIPWEVNHRKQAVGALGEQRRRQFSGLCYSITSLLPVDRTVVELTPGQTYTRSLSQGLSSSRRKAFVTSDGTIGRRRHPIVLCPPLALLQSFHHHFVINASQRTYPSRYPPQNTTAVPLNTV